MRREFQSVFSRHREKFLLVIRLHRKRTGEERRGFGYNRSKQPKEIQRNPRKTREASVQVTANLPHFVLEWMWTLPSRLGLRRAIALSVHTAHLPRTYRVPTAHLPRTYRAAPWQQAEAEEEEVAVAEAKAEAKAKAEAIAEDKAKDKALGRDKANGKAEAMDGQGQSGVLG